MKQVYKEVAEELGIDEATVEDCYKSYWAFIKKTLEELPLQKDLSEEEFSKLRTSFNIPYIGKFGVDFKSYKNIKSHKNNSDENKESKTVA